MATEIRIWLESMNLGQYADAFEENYVELADLPELSEDDLKELGMAAMGHRKGLIRAVAADRTDVASTSDQVPEAVQTQSAQSLGSRAPEPAKSQPGNQSHSAERRQLTVMFADLVGSTDLASRLDPEDVRDAITLYQKAITDVTNKFGGHVAKYMGDGVLCYFGWPRANEDDAERAARAGLEMVTALAPLTAPNGEPLVARIGIATGLVVVGDLVGEGGAQEEAVVGETPNLAARLQGIAAPGQVVISGTTQKLLSNSLDVEHIGSHDLKGISDPVDVYAVHGEHSAGADSSLKDTGPTNRMIGRDNEVSLLMDRWTRAVDGEGQVFLLSGEPGIGKSQIGAGLQQELAKQGADTLTLQCSPYYSSSPFYPVIGCFERIAGFDRDDSAEKKLDKLEALLLPVLGDDARAVTLLAAMLTLPLDRFPPLGLEPLRQKELTIAAIVDFFAATSTSSASLVRFEDAHWCDATTLEMLTALVQRAETIPVLMLITYRPEFQPPWLSYGNVTVFTLNRLGRRDSLSIIAEVTGSRSLPDEIVAQILAKTDGIPLFVEELTKTILEAGFLTETEHAFVLEGPLPPLAIPSTLQDSLMARLDRLSPVKEVAQIGACIGREFPYDLLASVSPLRASELRESLVQLAESELIFARGTPPEATYTFKHALVQDAAYSSVLRSRRQQLHAKIAQVLERDFAALLETEPELAAQHYTKAGLMADAVPFWLAAGRVAIGKFANEEALNHLNAGLECLLIQSQDGPRDEQELVLRATLGVAQFTARGYGAPELGENYENALSIARRIHGTPFRSPALFGVWAYHLMRVDHSRAAGVYSESLQLAQNSGVAHEMNAALAAATTSSVFMGQPQKSLDYADASWTAYDVKSHGELVALYGQDTGLWCADFGSWAAWLLGYADVADRRYAKANQTAKELGHPLSLASGLVHASLLYSMAGDVKRTLDYADQTIEVCEEVGIPARLVEAYIMKGWALSEMGQIDEGIALTSQGMAGWRGAGAEIARPWWLALQAQQYRRKGDNNAAIASLDEGLETVKRTGENVWASELNRLRGQILLEIDPTDTTMAETHFQTAMEIAQRQPAKYWELRAANSLGHLWADRGENQRSLETVRPIYDWFTEGADSVDLRNARDLIARLGD
ncbi:adenylate/guanylate cyclase domain-containing protein [Falsiruegeria mediterranea]